MVVPYASFINALTAAGFSGVTGGKDDGVFSLFRHVLGISADDGLPWHTGEPDTDPWEWRMRVLNERNDIAYAKVFYRKAGYITREWYPYFLTARRVGQAFEDAYQAGTAGRMEKRLYDTLQCHPRLPVHDIKRIAGIKKEDAARFDRALTELQMKLYITMCGGERKVSQAGAAYGWYSTVFCLTEDFWPPEVWKEAAAMTPTQAFEALSRRVVALHPQADLRKLARFITG